MRRLTRLLIAAALLGVAPANASVTSDPSFRQYTSAGHVLGFDSSGYYVSNGAYALRVRFEDAQAVLPSAEREARGDDLQRPRGLST